MLSFVYYLSKKIDGHSSETADSLKEVEAQRKKNRKITSNPLNIRRINTRLADAKSEDRDNALKEFLIAKGIFDRTKPIDISEIKTLTFEELNNEELITVSYLPNLIELNIAGTLVNNIDCLINLPELEHLNISETAVESIYPLKDLHLKTLIMKDTLINNYSALGRIKSLEYLDISKCNIKDIQSLKYLENLVHLDISNTKITDLSPIASLSKIKKLIYTDSSVVINSKNIELILRTR